jgi:hypothetical protein
MNESELEKELRSLRPANPSPKLAEQIAADLKNGPARVHEAAAGLLIRPPAKQHAWQIMRPWLLTLSSVSAVMLGFLAVSTWMKPGAATNASKPEPAAPVFTLNEIPDQSVDELIDAQDEGLVFGEDEEPQRQVRMVYLERHTWTNPQTGAVVEFEVPREDIILMPVAMQ